MELRIERGELAEAVAWAARVLPTRSPVPVLGGLLLEAEAGRLRVSGLDFEASARIEVAAEVARPGRALVLGRRLLDICRVLPDGAVECTVEGASRLAVSGGGGARFGVSLLPVDDYPAAPALPEFRGAVDAETFAAAVGQVAVAAGRDETLPVLTGLRVALEGETLTLAATDRYRYALRTIPWKPEVPSADVDVIVPARRLTEIARTLSRPGPLRLAVDAGSLGFEHAGRRATTRLLDGRLPRHDKLFALGDDHAVAVLDRVPLLEAVKRVAVVAERDSPVQLTFSPDSVHLQAGYEDDIASQRLPATLEGATDMTVAFNPAYLLDALSAFEAPTVHLHLLGPGQRALLTAGEDHQHLLMSMRPPLL